MLPQGPYVHAMNVSEAEIESGQIKFSGTIICGRPKASDVFSADDLEKMDKIGIYIKKGDDTARILYSNYFNDPGRPKDRPPTMFSLRPSA